MIFDVVARNNVDNIEKYLKNKIDNKPDTFIMDCFTSIEPFPQKTEDQKKMYKPIDSLYLNISPITDKELRIRHSYFGTPFELDYKKDHALQNAVTNRGKTNNNFIKEYIKKEKWLDRRVSRGLKGSLECIF